MPKKVVTKVKLQIPAGAANPSPPVGPALGQHGVNIMQFCQQFNKETQGKDGFIIPVELTIYEDRSFTFITKSSPAAILLKKAVGIAKASPEPNKIKVGKVSRKQLEEIARIKMKDLNAPDISRGAKIIEGTARSMGIEVEEESKV